MIALKNPGEVQPSRVGHPQREETPPASLPPLERCCTTAFPTQVFTCPISFHQLYSMMKSAAVELAQSASDREHSQNNQVANL